MRKRTRRGGDGPAPPLEELIAEPFRDIVGHWRRHRLAHGLTAPVERATGILDATAWLTGDPEVTVLGQAVAAGDDAALAALCELDRYLGLACARLVPRCNLARAADDMTTVRREAAIGLRLADGSGSASDIGFFAFLLALALRAFGQNEAAAEAYRRAIPAATAAGNLATAGSAWDNLGLILSELGRPEEALPCFEAARRLTGHRRDQAIIESNRARALQDMGELRAALAVQLRIVDDLDALDADAGFRGAMLDNAAGTSMLLGDVATAAELLTRAAAELATAPPTDQAVNAMQRARLHLRRGDRQAAGEAFTAAWALAVEAARRRLDPDHYRRGFAAARRARVGPGHPALVAYGEGLAVRETDRPTALAAFERAQAAADQAGDRVLALRIQATVAATFADAGAVVDAVRAAVATRGAAAAQGLAQPERMVVGTLAGLAQPGAYDGGPLGAVGLLATAAVLDDLHRTIVEGAGLAPAEQQWEAAETGHVDNELGVLAASFGADELAAASFQRAAAAAEALGQTTSLANRLAGLRASLAKLGRSTEANAVADRLGAMIERGDLRLTGQVVARRALADHIAATNAAAAITHLRAAGAAIELLRATADPGPGRAAIARQYGGVYATLARLLRQQGDPAGAFEALQGEKSRRLVDAMAAASGASTVRDEPPSAAEVVALLARTGLGTVVDLAVEPTGLTAYVVDGRGVRDVHVPGDPDRLADLASTDSVERHARVLETCLDDPLPAALATAIDAVVAPGEPLLVVTDEVLHNLPLHIAPVDGRAWCERSPIGYLGAAAALRFAPRERRVYGRSIVAGDSRRDLPHAAAECEAVGARLGTAPLIGTDCTRRAIEELLVGGELDVVHLALHGRADWRRGGIASLLFADGRGGTEWVLFEELAALPWRAELVTFSGCSTAVVGSRHGHELVGVARAAAESGAGAVVGCLWPVGDEAARIAMTAFYEHIADARAAGPVDLRESLDAARAALRRRTQDVDVASSPSRDGRDIRPVAGEPAPPRLSPRIASALDWAPFTVFGDPILGD